MFRLFTDTSADLTPKELLDLGVTAVPIGLSISLVDDRLLTYPGDGGNLPDVDDFYLLQTRALKVTTGALSAALIADIFRPTLSSGFDILYVGITPDMSEGVWNNLHLAKSTLEEEFPDRRVEIVNTHSISPGLGLLIDHLVNFCRAANPTLDEAIDTVNCLALDLAHLFTVNDFTHLRKTGRVSRFVAGVGSLMDLKPFMQLPYNGRLESTNTIRGEKRILHVLASRVAETILDPRDKIWVSYGASSELGRANTLASFLGKDLPLANISLHRIGPIIGAHTGPTVLAVFYRATSR